MNTIARSFGIFGETPAAARSSSSTATAAACCDSIPWFEREILQVGDAYGFIFGNGIIYNFLHEYYATGKPSPATAAQLIAARGRLDDGARGRWPSASTSASTRASSPTAIAGRARTSSPSPRRWSSRSASASSRSIAATSARDAFALLGIHTDAVGFVAELPRILARQADAPRQGDRPGGAPRRASRPTSSSSTSSTATPTYKSRATRLADAARRGRSCASYRLQRGMIALAARPVSSSFPHAQHARPLRRRDQHRAEARAQRRQLLPARGRPARHRRRRHGRARVGRGGLEDGGRHRRRALPQHRGGRRADLALQARRRRQVRRQPADRRASSWPTCASTTRRSATRTATAWAPPSSPALFLDDKVLIGHVGDSRVYRLRDGQLMQLTEDHSLLNDYIRMKRLSSDDVGKFPHKNVIVRALGMKESVQVDLLERSDEAGRHLSAVQRRAVGHGRRRRPRATSCPRSPTSTPRASG